MNQQLQDRLNQIPDKILTEEFLKSQGLGNEIGFWIFDYAPEDELQVRGYLEFLEGLLARKHAHLKVAHINLFQAMRDYLDQRNFTDKAIQLQQSKGDQALIKALSGPLHMDKFAPFLMEHFNAPEQDVVLMSGFSLARIARSQPAEQAPLTVGPQTAGSFLSGSLFRPVARPVQPNPQQ